MVRLAVLHTGHLYPPINTPGSHFCYRLILPQGHIAARRTMSMKNSNDTIGIWTRNLPACSTVPQPTVTPHAPIYPLGHKKKSQANLLSNEPKNQKLCWVMNFHFVCSLYYCIM
jgi:hypothetical protein